eukprot:CAMPEP_0179286456 /NCGR_PEP_ID=MMETSP0797-20121207/39753_1 /TAXON_ID=47934 /ORGANISM="Dinophysis acuminata, Strain DAEP01" /LENGTH=98 /DNA_ID=CAMNT_0020995345 /DNA_START=60 /DNA_END=353 /DNA_ORIENTATION=+
MDAAPQVKSSDGETLRHEPAGGAAAPSVGPCGGGQADRDLVCPLRKLRPHGCRGDGRGELHVQGSQARLPGEGQRGAPLGDVEVDAPHRAQRGHGHQE